MVQKINSFHNQLTDGQRSCLERAIVRHRRNIPHGVEIDGKQWLGGLQIDGIVRIGDKREYTVGYSWEDDNDKVRFGVVRISAFFHENIVEDIDIL